MKFLFASLAFAFLSGLAHGAENWPRFRGPNGAGGAESSIPAIWEKSSYRWQLPLKENGHGSPAVWGNLVFLNSSAEKGKTRKVICVDAKTGKLNWARAYPSKTHKTHRFNSFASSTPALDEQNAYSVWGIPRNSKYAPTRMVENFFGKRSGRSQGRAWFRGFTHCFRRSADRSQ